MDAQKDVSKVAQSKKEIEERAAILLKEVEESAAKRSSAQETIMANVRKEMEEATKESAEKEKTLADMAARLVPATSAPAEAASTQSGVTLVPTAPGHILHSNDVKAGEMHGEMMAAPQLAGLNAEQAKAFVAWSLTFMLSKAITVAPPHLLQPPPPLPQGPVQTQVVLENDEELTDLEMSEEEVEAGKMNSNDGESVPTSKKLKRSVKQTRTAARKAKTTGATTK